MIGARVLRVLRLRWRSLTKRAALDADLDRELAFHVDELVRERVELGLAPHEARHAARRAMGSVESAKEYARDERGMGWLEDLWRDLEARRLPAPR